MTRRPLSPRKRMFVLRRDGYACQYCGEKAPKVQLHVDHIVPVAAGGTDDDENLVTACSTCNYGKRADVTPDMAVYCRPRRYTPEDIDKFSQEAPWHHLGRLIAWQHLRIEARDAVRQTRVGPPDDELIYDDEESNDDADFWQFDSDDARENADYAYLRGIIAGLRIAQGSWDQGPVLEILKGDTKNIPPEYERAAKLVFGVMGAP